MKDGLHSQCKECCDKATTASRSLKPDKYKAIRKGSRDKFREESSKYKTDRGCYRCGEKHPAVLELHHPDPSIKDLNPSSSSSRKIFYNEAEKCDVVCANCHRIIHWELRNIRV